MTSTKAAGDQSARAAYHHGDLVHALVRAAYEQIAERGADAVSLRQVATAVGVSPSAAYAHFPDKQALLIAACDLSLAEFDGVMLAAAGSPVPDGPEGNAAAVERFWRAGETYVGFALERPHVFRHIFGPHCPWSKEGEPTAIVPSDLEYESVSYALLRDGLDDLDRRGLLRPGVRPGLDVLIWTTVHGFACLVLDGHVPLDWRDDLLRSIQGLIMSPAAGS
ncbi:MAG: TetR/AcrR family transcriptional regulator [Nocardioides sp.]